MKVPKWASLMWLGLLVAVSFSLSSSGAIKGVKKTTESDAEQSLLDWDLKTTVGAYQEVGKTNPAWDEPAIRVLSEYARHPFNKIRFTDKPWIETISEPWAENVRTNCDAAIKAGCDDPMVRYLYVRFSLAQTNSDKTLSDAFNNVALDMQKSSYPSIRKFFAANRAVIQASAAHGDTFAQTMPVVMEISGFVGPNLLAILQDETAPPEEVYETCDEFLEKFNWQPNNYIQAYTLIEPLLSANWPDESTTWLLKGEAYYQMAWNARGYGYANTATPEGLKTFENDLVFAESALNRAWDLNPEDARVPTKMVELVGAIKAGTRPIGIMVFARDEN